MKKIFALVIFAALLSACAYAYTDYDTNESKSAAANTKVKESEEDEDAAYFMTEQSKATAQTEERAMQTQRVESTSLVYPSESQAESAE